MTTSKLTHRSLACSAPKKGALILAISTDMQTPKAISVASYRLSLRVTPICV
jgi:hypothetical protein